MHLLLNLPPTNLFSFACILLLSYSIYELSEVTKRLQHQLSKNINGSSQREFRPPRQNSQPVAWIEGGGDQMFRGMGYRVVSDSVPDEWDVLWTHVYSLTNSRYADAIRNARPNQIVNHVAGSGYYTSKVWLATSQLSKGKPRAFQLPIEKNELLGFAKQNPGVMWVQKDNTHRNIRIRKVADMDLDKTDSFVQQFIDNPLLIDNRKFDIGIYTVVTSIHPLRVHVFEGEALIRFCTEDYNPFESARLDKYVVADDYTPIWEIPSLSSLFNHHKLGWRATLDTYLFLKGINATEIWLQMHAVIAEVFRNQQPNMLRAFHSISSRATFFELSRFDFVIDANLNVFLMEANMSPNLSPAHFSQNQILYGHVLFNLFSLVGIASTFTVRSREYLIGSHSLENYKVSDSDVYLSLPDCIRELCTACDTKLECQLCAHCMPAATQQMLRRTVIEYNCGHSMKMLTIDYSTRKPLTKEDHLLSIWRQAKCRKDSSWC